MTLPSLVASGLPPGVVDGIVVPPGTETRMFVGPVGFLGDCCPFVRRADARLYGRPEANTVRQVVSLERSSAPFSLSSPRKEERAGERRPFFISYPSLQLSPRSFLAGREGKTLSAFFMPDTREFGREFRQALKLFDRLFHHFTGRWVDELHSRWLLRHFVKANPGEDRPARVDFHDPEKEPHPPIDFPAAFQFACQQRRDRRGQIEFVARFKKHFDERRRVKTFHHFPVKLHRASDAAFVFPETL